MFFVVWVVKPSETHHCGNYKYSSISVLTSIRLSLKAKPIFIPLFYSSFFFLFSIPGMFVNTTRCISFQFSVNKLWNCAIIILVILSVITSVRNSRVSARLELTVFPSCNLPLFQDESSCKTLHMIKSIIFMG